MSKKELLWAAFVVAMVCGTYISVAYINATASFEKSRLRETEATERTKERWGTLPWNRKKP